MIAILTGDIVQSRKVDTAIWLPILKKVLSKFGKTPKDWEVFRGDSFQLKTTVNNALLVALIIKSHLKQIEKIDVRIGIGIGSQNTKSKNITEANGEAFINSGSIFDSLVKKQHLAIQSPWKTLDEELNISLELALLTMNSWTKNSAEIFQISIENEELTQKEIAKQLGITQGRVSERQKRAGFDAITKLEKRYRKLITQKTA